MKVQSDSKRRVRYYGACSMAAIASVLAAPAMAQPAGLEEVVVTARKVAENLQDVPVAVTAFSGADLEKQNAVRIIDISRMTPGLMFRQSSTNPSGLLVSMRGQFQRETSASQDPSVGIYVDGVYWARSYGLNADLLDIQSVQVLKGPQGTLFGRNTTGGAVLMQTNDPKYDRISGMGSILYGRFNEMTATAVLNVPIVTDRVAVRGALQINKRDGYLHDYVNGREYDNRDNITGRLKLGIQATDNLSVVLSAEKYRFEQAGQARSTFLVLPASDPRGGLAIYGPERGRMGGLTPAQYVAFTNANPSLTGQNSDLQPVEPALRGVPDSQYETETYSATASLDTGIGTFKAIGAYRSIEGHSNIDLDGSPWAAYTTSSSQDLEQYSAELQLTGKVGETLDYVGGLFWFKEQGSDPASSEGFTGGQTSASSLVRNTAGTRAVSENDILTKSAGVYGQLTWHATDKLNLTGGLRYSADERGVSMTNRAINPVTLLTTTCAFASLGAVRVGNTCTPVSRNDKYENTSYLASADYRLTEDVMVYGRVSKGYRSGGQNIRASSSLQFVPFGPETVYDTEVGLKSELFDRRLRLNVAGFRSTIEGAQRATRVQPPGGGANVTILGNAAKVRVWGVEAEATAVLGGGFTASVSGAYTKPKYLSYIDNGGDRSGERFNGVPEWQAAFMVSYERELGTAQLSLRADYGWASETPLDEVNSPATAFNAEYIDVTTRPAGGEANVRGTLTFADGRYEVAAFGRNIFDNRDRVSALSLIGFGFVAGQYREPATWGLQGTYRFGR